MTMPLSIAGGSRPLRRICALLLCAAVFGRCANVKEVNSFAVSSRQTLEKQRDEDFGYSAYSHDSTYLFHYLPDHLRDVDCPCEAGKKADAHIASEYNLLSTYFATLARFCDPGASVNFAPMGSPLAAGAYGPINISTQEANYNAYLAKALTALATTRYKTKKIPQFMASYRDSVAPLITLLKIRADNLAGRMINLQLQLDRVTDSLISFSPDRAVKMPVLFVYEQKRKDLDATLAHYRQRVHELETIIAGGQLIADNLDNLHSQSFKEKMTGLVNALALNVH
jgi:hypothetical protein